MTLKKALCNIAAAVAMFPVLMIFNDNGNFIPNVIGLAYVIGMMMLYKHTQKGRKAMNYILDNM